MHGLSVIGTAAVREWPHPIHSDVVTEQRVYSCAAQAIEPLCFDSGSPPTRLEVRILVQPAARPELRRGFEPHARSHEFPERDLLTLTNALVESGHITTP